MQTTLTNFSPDACQTFQSKQKWNKADLERLPQTVAVLNGTLGNTKCVLKLVRTSENYEETDVSLIGVCRRIALPMNKHYQEDVSLAPQRAELITDMAKGNNTVMICQSSTK